MKRIKRVLKENIQLPHLLILVIACCGLFYGFRWLEEQAFARNQELVYASYYIPALEVPEARPSYLKIYDNLLNIAKNGIPKRTKSINEFLTANPDITELIPAEFCFNDRQEIPHGDAVADISHLFSSNIKYNDMLKLMTYLMWRNCYEEEARCFSFLLNESVESMTIIPNQESAKFYSEFSKVYFDSLYIKPIKEEWKVGNFYKARKMADNMKQRYDLLRFENYEQLPLNVRKLNEHIILIALAAKYAPLYAVNNDLGNDMYQCIFEQQDSLAGDKNLTISVPFEMKPFTFYLRGLQQMLNNNYTEALRLFSNVQQQKVEPNLSEYGYFMTSRCLFKAFEADPSADKLKRFMDESAWSCMHHIKSPNLLAELKDYQQKALLVAIK